jgi:hypothetical protein
MENILKRAAIAILGLVVTLGYWSFRGDPNASTETEGIPSKVWEGGGLLAVEIDSTTSARLSISFAHGEDKSLHTWTRVTPGVHTWVISVPTGAGGEIELSADSPKVGDKLSWKIRFNGETFDDQTETLEKPLSPGYGFFLQSYYEDFSTMGKESRN